MPFIDSDSFLFKYLLSCAAATVAETATYPLDLTKTRLQIQGEVVRKSTDGRVAAGRRGFLQTGLGIMNEEGFLKLWQGITPAVLRHYVYTGIRVGVYEQMREKLFHRKVDGTFPVWKALVSGAMGGAIAQAVASPMDLVKVQMQMEGRRRLEGHPPRVKNMVHCVSRVVSESGIRGLWKGWIPNCQRAALVNMADLATYDTIKHTLLRYTTLHDNYVTHTLSSFFAGFGAAVVSTPADVIKTRIMNQPTDSKGRGQLYKSSVDCLLQTVKREGFFALYKGFVPIWARMVLFFALYKGFGPDFF